MSDINWPCAKPDLLKDAVNKSISIAKRPTDWISSLGVFLTLVAVIFSSGYPIAIIAVFVVITLIWAIWLFVVFKNYTYSRRMADFNVNFIALFLINSDNKIVMRKDKNFWNCYLLPCLRFDPCMLSEDINIMKENLAKNFEIKSCDISLHYLSKADFMHQKLSRSSKKYKWYYYKMFLVKIENHHDYQSIDTSEFECLDKHTCEWKLIGDLEAHKITMKLNGEVILKIRELFNRGLSGLENSF